MSYLPPDIWRYIIGFLPTCEILQLGLNKWFHENIYLCCTDVNASYTNLTNEQLARMKNLTDLNTTRDSLITRVDTPLRYLAAGSCIKTAPTSLTGLYLDSCSIIENLYALTNLTKLILCDGVPINDTIISQMTTLRHLEVEDDVTITDAGIRGLTNLTYLDIDVINVTSHGFSRMTNLTELYTCGPDVSSISTLVNLIRLGVEGGALTSVDDLLLLTNLTDLSVSYSMNDNILSKLTWLKKLWLEGDNVTDHGLSTLTNLSYLCISDTYVTSYGLSVLTSLTSLSVDDHFDDISALTGLTSLSMVLNLTVTNLTNLTNLYLPYNADVQELLSLPALRSLHFHSSFDTCLGNLNTCISDFTNLTKLNISNLSNVITDSSLCLLTGLINLNINFNPDITDQSVSKLTNLTKLRARGTSISDAGVFMLVNMRSLLCWQSKITNRGTVNMTQLKEIGINTYRRSNSAKPLRMIKYS